MHIQENIENYRIVVYEDDLKQLGKSLEETIEQLKQASALTGKHLSAHTIDSYDGYWIIFIDKEK